MHVTIDFETRSEVDLRKTGASVYARHPSTSVLCLAWMAENQIALWKPGDDAPDELLELIKQGVLIEAHNAFFERSIWRWVCHARLGWPDVPFSQWRCSMAAASRMGLPRSLNDASTALGLKERKSPEGASLIQALCKPRPESRRKGKKPEKWDNDPAKLSALYQYCKQDVNVEHGISEAVPPLTPSELQVWQLDQKINLRGIPIDRSACEHALEVIKAQQGIHSTRINELTDKKVSSVRSVGAMLEFIRDDVGVEMADLRADTVSRTIEETDDPLLEEILTLRLEASKSSTAKVAAMLEHCDTDGRVRETIAYHGAATGRFAGRGIQIQNYPRGSMSVEEIELMHRLLPARNGQAIDLLFGSPPTAISSVLRSMIRAPKGSRLMVCDFAQIEARVLAWLAYQPDLLEAFSNNEDVYVDMAAKIYDVDSEQVDKPMRNVGKMAILGLGYGMGYKSFVRACDVMAGVQLNHKFAKGVVRTYRKSNKNIADYWRVLNTTAIRCLTTHKAHQASRIVARDEGNYLTLELPSKRKLHYWDPKLVEVVAPWSIGYIGTIWGPEDREESIEDTGIELGPRDGDHWDECHVPKEVYPTLMRSKTLKSDLEEKEPQMIQQIEYSGFNSTIRKWTRLRTYGGKLVENVTQAVARDFLVSAMLRVEAAGYPIIATVHDEIICEVPNGQGSMEEFEALMKQTPVTWGSGCPIEVEGYEAERYRK